MRQLLAILLLLALCACQAKKPGLLHIDPALESFVPADTVFVAGANLDQIRGTTAYQKLLSRVPLPQLDDFARQTGLDPRKDLSQILSCTNGRRGLLMARGKFNRADLEKRLEQQGLKPIPYKDRRMFGSENQSIAILNDTIAVAGPPAELRAIIDGRTTAGLPPALRDLLRTLPQNDQIYAALSGGLSGLNLAAPENSNLANVMQALRSVNSATLGMDLSSGLQLMAAVNCNTEKDAKFVHDLLKGVIGLGRLNTPDNQQEMLKLYDAIQVNQQQTRTEVQANISQEQADKFLDLWLKR
ncbi:MAG TPA: hypothetical protein VKX49_09380 [Bryobacteraceae bacterium]|nr:hypothetical protein [Bryobacteraceae bacterium]